MTAINHRKIGFFSYFWGMGYGVPAVIRSQIEILTKEAYEIDVFAIEVDPKFVVAGVRVFQVPGSLVGLRSFIDRGGYSCVIAHTQPFQRFVADLRGNASKIIYDHGEPPPDWFPDQRSVREAMRREKLELVCPKADLVVAISKFIAEEIPWPDAKILYNGADHLYRKFPTDIPAIEPSTRPKFLCVARFGPNERLYKGLDQLVTFAEDFKDRFEVILAGKGGLEDRVAMEKAGLTVALNPSDRELSDLYRKVDAVISFSRWEGFNLPIIEGAFFGRPGYALDIGAHKEVTPFCFGSYEALRNHLRTADKDTLRIEGQKMKVASERFTWRRNVDELVKLLDASCGSRRRHRHPLAAVTEIVFRCHWNAWSAAKRWKKRLFLD